MVTLTGQEAKDFLKEMQEPPTPADLEYKHKLDSLKRIIPL